jgi:hypothetical protein
MMQGFKIEIFLASVKNQPNYFTFSLFAPSLSLDNARRGAYTLSREYAIRGGFRGQQRP